ncbi:MAG: thioredoxin domain-containing protein [Sphingobacteriales bacterium]|nr:thioredoxin domain-containing protein [Sphingobacteriales bacterium]
MNHAPFTNHLQYESSPYLLQHAHQPVNWFAWNDTALQTALSQQKLIIISSGYAACHWCHVMAHECFEDETVAALMNEYFVSIKIDREERPDLDSTFMNVCQIIQGNGGWPLNVIALPDGRPIYAGTYFPKAQWLELLHFFINMQRENPEKLEQQAQAIVAGVQAAAALPTFSASAATFRQSDLDNSMHAWLQRLDWEEGGRQGAPKFPMPDNYRLLLRYFFISRHEPARNFVLLTLDKMAQGGIYDHLGGGFARYSTDRLWFAPHFEKMLYDNAQLVSLYSEAFRLTKKPTYLHIIQQTLEFVERELYNAAEGVFYTALDADSEGEEGRFYTWTAAEINELLSPEQAAVAVPYYHITAAGNWEQGRNILYEDAQSFALLEQQPEAAVHLEAAKKILSQARRQRISPALDDKSIVAWNALMLQAFCDAYQALGEAHYLQTALRNAEFLWNTSLQTDGSLRRIYKKGETSIIAFLDDYAALIAAFIALYQCNAELRWLHRALQLTEYVIAHFGSPASPLFYYTDVQQSEILTRGCEISDNVIASSNSIMARNLLALGVYFRRDDYTQRAQNMLEACLASQKANEGLSKVQVAFFSNWLILYCDLLTTPSEVAIVGNDSDAVLKVFHRIFAPNMLLATLSDSGELPFFNEKTTAATGDTQIYICKNRNCYLPVSDVAEAVVALTDNEEASENI